MSNFIPPSTATGSGGTSSVDIETVVAFYDVVTAAAQMAVGDTLQRVSYIRTSDQTAIGTDRWINLNTFAILTGAPTAANIRPQKPTSSSTDFSTVVVKTTEQADSALNTVIGTKTDAEATAASGSFSLISLIKRLISLCTGIAEKIPALVGGKIPVEATMTSWETVEYRVDATGAVVYEKEKNGALVRSRNWTSTTDANGVVSYVAGEWA